MTCVHTKGKGTGTESGIYILDSYLFNTFLFFCLTFLHSPQYEASLNIVITPSPRERSNQNSPENGQRLEGL